MRWRVSRADEAGDYLRHLPGEVRINDIITQWDRSTKAKKRRKMDA